MNRKVLAAGPVTRIEICPCGSCYLTIGPITMALQLGVLSELGDVVARAMTALRNQGSRPLRGRCLDAEPDENQPDSPDEEENPATPDSEPPPFAN